jgi:hypothetical protein
VGGTDESPKDPRSKHFPGKKGGLRPVKHKKLSLSYTKSPPSESQASQPVIEQGYMSGRGEIIKKYQIRKKQTGQPPPARPQFVFAAYPCNLKASSGKIGKFFDQTSRS